MNLEQIQEQEDASNESFRQWMNSRQFHSVQNSLKEDLIIYVSALLHEIGDLKADVLRLQSECDVLKNRLYGSAAK
jgi:predicted HD phosphohydrolase